MSPMRRFASSSSAISKSCCSIQIAHLQIAPMDCLPVDYLRHPARFSWLRWNPICSPRWRILREPISLRIRFVTVGAHRCSDPKSKVPSSMITRPWCGLQKSLRFDCPRASPQVPNWSLRPPCIQSPEKTGVFKLLSAIGGPSKAMHPSPKPTSLRKIPTGPMSLVNFKWTPRF